MLPDLRMRRLAHREAAVSQMDQYRRDARIYRLMNDVSQWAVIVGSFAITALTGIGAQREGIRWATVTVSAVVGSVAGGMAYFKFRARSHNSQQTADAIERELVASWLGLEDYAERDDDAASALLAERIEDLRKAHQQRARELEQAPPRTRGTSSAEGNTS